jgi:signal transduction histidine kinase
MVEQRVDELNSAYQTLAKLDKNKSDFIQVAAHELRTPLTVIKGYLGMIKTAPVVQENPTLRQVTDGVIQGTNRLHQIVNSMLDVARLENQVLTPHLESVALGLVLRLVCKDYAEDLEERRIKLELDPMINTIFIDARPIQVNGHGDYCEIRVRDTGIGIDPANHKIVFEKLYQLGKVELHSSGRTKFKGGGPGLGLAIAAGIVKSHRGKIWVESPGYDEEKLPGSTFIIQIPLAK